MGCKISKVQPYEQQEPTRQETSRKVKHRPRDENRSHHETTVTEPQLPLDDSRNDQHKIRTILHTNNDTVCETPRVVDEFVDIEIRDSDAFNHVLIQQRQQAIDNDSYRSIIQSWQPKSLPQFSHIIQAFSKGKPLIDCHWIIFYWIAINIEYDTVAYFSKNYQDQSAESVFRTRKGVCAGYANLYKYLCDQLKIPCEIVSGYSKGYGFDDREGAPAETDHAWNVVQIDQHWYLLDSTWGAGHLNDAKQFQRELTTYYFLTRPNEMIYHHLPEQPKWQLLRTPIKMSQFLRMPHLRSEYFQFNLEMIQPRNQNLVQFQPNKSFALVIMKSPNNVQLLADLKLNNQKIDGGHRVIFNRKKQLYYCYFAPPTVGKHKITIYAKQGRAEAGRFISVLDLTLNVTEMPLNPISYPQTWNCFFDFGLKVLSPTKIHIINLKPDERFTQILIGAPPTIDLLGQLKDSNDEIVTCGTRVFYDREQNFWRCKFAPNATGIFNATILAKRKVDKGNYTSAISFKLNVPQITHSPFSFAQTWQLFHDLNLRILHPLNRGIITLHDNQSYTEIRIQTPNDVSLISKFTNDKHQDISGGTQVYYDHEKDFWKCKFAPKSIGIFDAIILAKKKSDSGSFTSVVLFKIIVKHLPTQPMSLLDTTQLFHDLQLKVLSPVNTQKIILDEKSSFVEICLKTPVDVLLLGQLIDSNKQRVLNADQVYYDRHKDIWHCQFAPNHNGIFDAVILAKKKSDSGPYFTAVKFQIVVKYISKTPLTFPHTWQSFYDYDLKIEAPRSRSFVIWPENASYAEVLIRAPNDIQLSCQIEYNNLKIPNGSLAQYNHEKQLWQLLFAPEQTGQHELIVYAKRINDAKTSAHSVVQFNLDVTTLHHPIKFPTIYTQFETTKCRIYTPLNGILKKGSTIPIHCIIPDAKSIYLTIDSKQIQSKDYKNSILQQDITVGSKEVTIHAQYDQTSSYFSLIRYSVE